MSLLGLFIIIIIIIAVNWIRLVFSSSARSVLFLVLPRLSEHSNAAAEMSVLAISSWPRHKFRQLTIMCTRAHPTIAAVNLCDCFIEAYYLFISIEGKYCTNSRFDAKYSLIFHYFNSNIYAGFAVLQFQTVLLFFFVLRCLELGAFHVIVVHKSP